MIRYLVDTDVLIEHIRGRQYLATNIINQGLGISIITLAELLYGAYKSSNQQQSLDKIDQLFKLGVKVEGLSVEMVIEYAKLKVDLEKIGQRLDEFDLLIGATAKSLGLTLVTKNMKHFKRIPQLKLA